MELWRIEQKKSFANLDSLLTFLEFPLKAREQFSKQSSFPLLVPMRIAKKMRKNDLSCPLLKQFLPTQKELEKKEGFTINPVGDIESLKLPKLIHKYSGRLLLTPSSACAMNCRYCFRRSFPYDKTSSSLENELLYIKNNTTIHEVIFSGGDPLSLSDDKLSSYLHEIDTIDHVSIIRFHTRLPIGIPERITEKLLHTLSRLRCQVIFVLHINHKEELDVEIFSSIKKLQNLGIPILCQSVLLKGVNDSKEVLKELYLLLISHGILPYYLHQLDKVEGAAHFEVKESIGEKLITSLREELPGYAIPQYVRETQGEKSKTPIKNF